MIFSIYENHETCLCFLSEKEVKPCDLENASDVYLWFTNQPSEISDLWIACNAYVQICWDKNTRLATFIANF